MTPNTTITTAVEEALARQPWYVQRKDSITAIAGIVLQIANFVSVWAAGAPHWVAIIIAVVIGAAQVVVHAGTQGAITPSMAQRLEAAAASVFAQASPFLDDGAGYEPVESVVPTVTEQESEAEPTNTVEAYIAAAAH